MVESWRAAARLRPLTAFREFLKLESAAGLLLLAMMLLALLLVNSPAAAYYRETLELPVEVRVGAFLIAKPLLLWVNDGLMAIFFLLVGAEIKREMLEGELAAPSQIALPALAALGGMAAPALIYVAVNQGDALALRGWAIPSATDIAFSLGILSLLGRRVPVSLKLFLATLAILDDLGAIVIIAVFYTEQLSLLSLILAGCALAVLVLFNSAGMRKLAPYLLVALVLWVCMLKSGVHATLAGVALAFVLPLRLPSLGGRQAPLRRVEKGLHPWVAYGILPAFALANSGLAFGALELATFSDPVFLGIALGLVIGKQIGVFSFAWATIRLGIARLPDRASWAQLYGVSILTGIGFTMSLFIGGLAFDGPAHMVETRLGVLTGSAVSAGLGYLLLRRLRPRQLIEPNRAGADADMGARPVAIPAGALSAADD